MSKEKSHDELVREMDKATQEANHKTQLKFFIFMAFVLGLMSFTFLAEWYNGLAKVIG